MPAIISNMMQRYKIYLKNSMFLQDFFKIYNGLNPDKENDYHNKTYLSLLRIFIKSWQNCSYSPIYFMFIDDEHKLLVV